MHLSTRRGKLSNYKTLTFWVRSEGRLIRRLCENLLERRWLHFRCAQLPLWACCISRSDAWGRRGSCLVATEQQAFKTRCQFLCRSGIKQHDTTQRGGGDVQGCPRLPVVGACEGNRFQTREETRPGCCLSDDNPAALTTKQGQLGPNSPSSTAKARANCSKWAVTRSTTWEEEASIIIIRWWVEHNTAAAVSA